MSNQYLDYNGLEIYTNNMKDYISDYVSDYSLAGGNTPNQPLPFKIFDTIYKDDGKFGKVPYYRVYTQIPLYPIQPPKEGDTYLIKFHYTEPTSDDCNFEYGELLITFLNTFAVYDWDTCNSDFVKNYSGSIGVAILGYKYRTFSGINTNLGFKLYDKLDNEKNGIILPVSYKDGVYKLLVSFMRDTNDELSNPCIYILGQYYLGNHLVPTSNWADIYYKRFLKFKSDTSKSDGTTSVIIIRSSKLYNLELDKFDYNAYDIARCTARIYQNKEEVASTKNDTPNTSWTIESSRCDKYGNLLSENTAKNDKDNYWYYRYEISHPGVNTVALTLIIDTPYLGKLDIYSIDGQKQIND